MTTLAGEYIAPQEAHRKRKKLSKEFVDEVLKVVKMHSSDNPIRAIDLAHHFEHEHDRYVRAAIRRLIDEHHPIASLTDRNNPGFFYTRTKAEANKYIRSLRSRVDENFLRLKAYTIAANVSLDTQVDLIAYVEQLRLGI